MKSKLSYWEEKKVTLNFKWSKGDIYIKTKEKESLLYIFKVNIEILNFLEGSISFLDFDDLLIPKVKNFFQKHVEIKDWFFFKRKSLKFQISFQKVFFTDHIENTYKKHLDEVIGQ